MVDFGDRTGNPPTAGEFRAAIAGTIPDDMPITAALMENIAQVAEQQTGDRDRDLAKHLSAIIKAIGDIERRVADIEARR